jgi:hypothetical protein
VAVSSFAVDDAVGGGGEPGIVSPASAELDMPTAPPLRTTRLDRYLAVFDPALNLVAQDLLATSREKDGRGYSTGWQPENTLRTQSATAGGVNLGAFDLDSGDLLASDTEGNVNIETLFPPDADAPRPLLVPQSGSTFAMSAKPIASIAALSTAAIAWGVARSRFWFRQPAVVAPRMRPVMSPHSIRRSGARGSMSSRGGRGQHWHSLVNKSQTGASLQKASVRKSSQNL